MARRNELPAEAVSLMALGKTLEVRRLTHLEKIGTGSLSETEIREHIGRAKEDQWLMDTVSKRIKELHDGGDE